MTCNCSNSSDFWGCTHRNNESAPEVQKSFLYCTTSCFFVFKVAWPSSQLVEWAPKYRGESLECLPNWVSFHVFPLFFLYFWKCWSLFVPVCICIIFCTPHKQKTQPSNLWEVTKSVPTPQGQITCLVYQYLTLTWLTYHKAFAQARWKTAWYCITISQMVMYKLLESKCMSNFSENTLFQMLGTEIQN